MKQTIPGGEPFFFPGNSLGCLLIHGFTSTPQEMRWMGEYLAARGYTVLGMRLSGHATTLDDLARSKWTDWVASAEDGYHMLSCTCSQVIPIGLSLGGALTLMLASRFPVTALIAMSTPYDLSRIPNNAILRALSLVRKSIPKGPPDWRDPIAADARVQYDAYSTHAVIQLRALLREMRSYLSQIKAPALLMHSRSDDFITPHNMTAIYKRLGSKEKSTKWVEKSNHIITCDCDRMEVFQEAAAFIHQIAGDKK